MSSPPAPRWALRHPPAASFAGAVGAHELPLLAPVAPLAEALAPALAALGLRAVVSSPRQRCLALAQALAAALRTPLHIEPRLRELEHGRFTGHTWDALDAYDHAAYRYWLAHWTSSGPPDGGESAEALAARVGAAVEEAPPRSLLVTHRGPLQALHHLAGLPWPEAAAAPCPNAGEPGGLWRIELAENPRFTMVRCSRYDGSSAPLASRPPAPP